MVNLLYECGKTYFSYCKNSLPSTEWKSHSLLTELWFNFVRLVSCYFVIKVTFCIIYSSARLWSEWCSSRQSNCVLHVLPDVRLAGRVECTDSLLKHGGWWNDSDFGPCLWGFGFFMILILLAEWALWLAGWCRRGQIASLHCALSRRRFATGRRPYW